jgi:hypothetical protein
VQRQSSPGRNGHYIEWRGPKIILGKPLDQPYFGTGDRWNSSSLGGREDTGDVEVLPCSPLVDSVASQNGEGIAYAAALPSVQETYIWLVESFDQERESGIQEVGAAAAAARHRSIHIDDLSEEVVDPRSGSCAPALYHSEIAMDPWRGNGRRWKAQGLQPLNPHGSEPSGGKSKHCLRLQHY